MKHQVAQKISVDLLREAVAAEPKILFAYLFGSVATGDTSPLSDIDIAVYPSEKLSVDDRLGIIQRLGKKTKRDDLDITFLDRLSNLFVRAAIIDQGIVLVDKDPDLRDYYEVMAHHEYLDFRYQRKLYMGE